MNNLNIDQYASAIEKYGKYVTSTVGTSMLPMLRSGIDSVVLEKPTRDFKKYDCVMYKRPSTGKYVLHRIIKIKKGQLIICGDNQWQKEYGITKDDIIAIVTGFYKKEKYISVDKFSYKLYYHFRVFFRPLRRFRDFLSKIKHKIFK